MAPSRFLLSFFFCPSDIKLFTCSSFSDFVRLGEGFFGVTLLATANGKRVVLKVCHSSSVPSFHSINQLFFTIFPILAFSFSPSSFLSLPFGSLFLFSPSLYFISFFHSAFHFCSSLLPVRFRSSHSICILSEFCFDSSPLPLF